MWLIFLEQQENYVIRCWLAEPGLQYLIKTKTGTKIKTIIITIIIIIICFVGA